MQRVYRPIRSRAINDSAVRLAFAAIDLQERYIHTLKEFSLSKVVALCANLQTDGHLIGGHGPFDTVVLAEIIEHLNFSQEIALLQAIRPYLAPTARFVITTPIGFMWDPDHKRGFSKSLLLARSRLLYGSIITQGDNTVQQYVVCQRRSLSQIRQFLQDIIARLLDWIFVIRPSGQPWITFFSILRFPLRVFRAFCRILIPS